MISRRITVADVSCLTGFSRHKLRGLLRELPSFDERAERARVAREYSPQDLAVLTVCCELESRYGLRRDAIGTLVEELRKAISGPRSVSSNARLIISVSPLSVKYVDDAENVAEGIALPLGGIFRRIDNHLTIDSKSEWGGQRNLDLDPVIVVSDRSRQLDTHDTNTEQPSSRRKAGGDVR